MGMGMEMEILRSNSLTWWGLGLGKKSRANEVATQRAVDPLAWQGDDQ